MNAVNLFGKYHKLTKNTNISAINRKWNRLQFTPNENILEIGCGTGASTKLLLEYIPPTYNKFVATDILKTMIDYARIDIPATVEFDQLDISSELALKDQWIHTFDKVFSFCTIHWVPKERQLQCFTNLNRLMKIGGTTFIVLITDTPTFDTFAELYKNPRWRPYYKDEYEGISPYNKHVENRKEMLEDILKKTHLEILDLEYMDIYYQLRNMDEFKNTMKSFNPFASRIPVDDLSDYWNDLWKSHEKYGDAMKTGQIWKGIYVINTRKSKHME